MSHIPHNCTAPEKMTTCEVCSAQPSKYRCPSCQTPSCSLKCSRAHKAQCMTKDSRSGQEAKSLELDGQPASPSEQPLMALLSNGSLQQLFIEHPVLRSELHEIFQRTLQRDPGTLVHGEHGKPQRRRGPSRSRAHHPTSSGREPWAPEEGFTSGMSYLLDFEKCDFAKSQGVKDFYVLISALSTPNIERRRS